MAEQVAPQRIYHFERAFTRNVGRGMKVQYGRTVNLDTQGVIDHYELSMPGYELTVDGPEIIDVDTNA